MKTLWFKGSFVAGILDGTKVDTIRKASNRLPVVGQRVAFSVGARPAFAEAEVLSIEKASRVSKARRAALVELYGDDLTNMVRITFRVVPRT